MKSVHNEHFFIKAINDGYLKIDEDGRIWRIAAKYGKNKFVKVTERELGCVNKNGYVQISFHKNEKTCNCLVHRILWTYFNGEIFNNKQINHKNGIKDDNRLENLELVTASENHKHAFAIRLRNNEGEKHPGVKLTNDNIREIRLRYLKGETQISIAKDFNVNRSQIGHIINRRSWSHI